MEKMYLSIQNQKQLEKMSADLEAEKEKLESLILERTKEFLLQSEIQQTMQQISNSSYSDLLPADGSIASIFQQDLLINQIKKKNRWSDASKSVATMISLTSSKSQLISTLQSVLPFPSLKTVKRDLKVSYHYGTRRDWIKMMVEAYLEVGIDIAKSPAALTWDHTSVRADFQLDSELRIHGFLSPQPISVECEEDIITIQQSQMQVAKQMLCVTLVPLMRGPNFTSLPSFPIHIEPAASSSTQLEMMLILKSALGALAEFSIYPISLAQDNAKSFVALAKKFINQEEDRSEVQIFPSPNWNHNFSPIEEMAIIPIPDIQHTLRLVIAKIFNPHHLILIGIHPVLLSPFHVLCEKGDFKMRYLRQNDEQNQARVDHVLDREFVQNIGRMEHGKGLSILLKSTLELKESMLSQVMTYKRRVLLCARSCFSFLYFEAFVKLKERFNTRKGHTIFILSPETRNAIVGILDGLVHTLIFYSRKFPDLRPRIDKLNEKEAEFVFSDVRAIRKDPSIKEGLEAVSVRNIRKRRLIKFVPEKRGAEKEKLIQEQDEAIPTRQDIESILEIADLQVRKEMLMECKEFKLVFEKLESPGETLQYLEEIKKIKTVQKVTEEQDMQEDEIEEEETESQITESNEKEMTQEEEESCRVRAEHEIKFQRIQVLIEKKLKCFLVSKQGGSRIERLGNMSSIQFQVANSIETPQNISEALFILETRVVLIDLSQFLQKEPIGKETAKGDLKRTCIVKFLQFRRKLSSKNIFYDTKSVKQDELSSHQFIGQFFEIQQGMEKMKLQSVEPRYVEMSGIETIGPKVIHGVFTKKEANIQNCEQIMNFVVRGGSKWWDILLGIEK
jgi:hypothetical protein